MLPSLSFTIPKWQLSGLDINWKKKKKALTNEKKQTEGKITIVLNFFQSLGKWNQEPHPVPDKSALPQPHPQPVQMGLVFYFHFFLPEITAT